MARKYRQTGTVATVRIGRAPAAMRQEIGSKEGDCDDCCAGQEASTGLFRRVEE